MSGKRDMVSDAAVYGFLTEEDGGGQMSQFQSHGSLGAAESDVPEGLKGSGVDPVHGEIKIPSELEPLLHTEPLHRLKRLRQLGACSLVRNC
jgi:hypothetical protein